MIDYSYGQINKRDIRFFNVAKSVSRTSEHPKVHVGCCVVYKNSTILAVGTNIAKTHPLQVKYNIISDRALEVKSNNLHAEINALNIILNHRDVNNIDWSKVSIYVYRESKDKKMKLFSQPCPACMALIEHLNIHTICYIDLLGNYCKIERLDK